MTAAARISCEIGATERKTAENQERMLKMAALPTSIDRPTDPHEIVQQLKSDKKRLAGRVRWVLPKTIGEVFLTDQVPPDVALDVLRGMIGSKKAEP
jgi:3-dehydroquinate synthase